MPSDPPPLPPPWPRRHNRPSCASFRQLQSLLSQHDKLVAEQEFYIDDLNDRFSDLNREIHYTGLAVQDHGAHSHNYLDRHEESARLAQRARKQATPTSYDDPGMKHRMRAVDDHDSRYRRNNGAAARSPPDQHISDVERDFFDFPLRDKSSLPIRNAPENRTCPGREHHRPGPDEPWDELERSIVPPVTEDMHKVLEDDPMSRFNMTRTPRAMACARAAEIQHEQGPSKSRSPKLPEGWSWHPGYVLSSSFGPEDGFKEGPHWCYTSPGGGTRAVKPAPPADEVSPSRHYRHRLAQREERRSVRADESGRPSPPPVPRRSQAGWTWRPGYRQTSESVPTEERIVLAQPHWTYRSPGGRVKETVPGDPLGEASPSMGHRHMSTSRGRHETHSENDPRQLSPPPVPYKPGLRGSRRQIDERFLDSGVPVHDNDDYPPMPRRSPHRPPLSRPSDHNTPPSPHPKPEAHENTP